MSAALQFSDHTKLNCMQKCFYMLNLIKNKDTDIWETFKNEYECISVDESYDFYQLLVKEYSNLVSGDAPAHKKRNR
jgi:hypothetical protein